MSGGHTPGPWKLLPSCGVYALDENNEVNRFSAMIDGGYRVYSRRQRDAGANATTADELAANARLIAAAPDLLEALADMLSEFDADEFGSEGQMQTCSAARAAIAKATGK